MDMAQEDTARAFWVHSPGVGALLDEPLAPLGDGDVRVRALFSGISRGTEGRVFRGEVPSSVGQVLRCPHQVGDFPAPVKYGYMSVGRVEAGRGDEAEALVGRTVFCLHPHQDRYVVSAGSVIPLPDGVPAERAVLAANLETAVNGVWDSGACVGDRVAVVGAGVVGLLSAWLCRSHAGSEVVAVDPEASRGEPAAALGVRWLADPPPDFDADVVIHASGSEAGLRSALELAGVEARVIELSWFGAHPVGVPLGEAFHPRRLTLRSSQVGRIPPERAPRWTHRRRLELALRLLRDPATAALINAESAFEDLPATMAALAGPGDRETLCHRVTYRTKAAGG